MGGFRSCQGGGGGAAREPGSAQRQGSWRQCPSGANGYQQVLCSASATSAAVVQPPAHLLLLQQPSRGSEPGRAAAGERAQTPHEAGQQPHPRAYAKDQVKLL